MELRDTAFRGGCTEAMAHLEHYFSRSHASIYKQTRNALQGWSNSTRFSPWLANGCLSPRRILSRLKAYEQAQGSNESTYWISFELLWREYFQWYALKHRARLFARSGSGIATRTPLTSFYPERFKQWCQGTTPWPLVNACMRELNATGFISNRGRQIAASCLVNELNIDWRYGAAWFQQQLIDHDVASNWGNWQYIAGVGADPRGGRHFNLVRQAEQFDPDGEYVSRWAPETASSALDSRDAADWPVWVRHD
jgi:deoxyribodipyrimidine photo-lyase